MAEDLEALAVAAMAASVAHEDPDYPLFHLAPPVGRLNDPNGLVVRDGVFHACYQFSPFHPHRKLVYWGHASSTDLVHWQQHRPAIVPDSWYDRNGAYSGSAVTNGDETVFVYTGNVRLADEGRETYQCLVRSSDMEHFTKDANNPVIPAPPPGYTAHVRDPQVWHDGTRYRMCLGAQRANETGCALLYTSADLLEWSFEGELTFPESSGRFDALGYMWECPAIIQVPDEATDQLHDVLIFCPQGISEEREGFENIFPACYLVGRLEGTRFITSGDFHEIDRGFEFYAPQVFAEAGRTPVLLAWAGNASEDDQPSLEWGWVHLMSAARELSVREGRLVQRPRVPLQATATETIEQAVLGEGVAPACLSGSRAFMLTADLDVGEGEMWRLRIGSEDSHIDILMSADSLDVDRTTARYAPATRHVTLPHRSSHTLTLLHDRSVTEIIVDDGVVAFTMRSYLAPEATGCHLSASVAEATLRVRCSRFD